MFLTPEELQQLTGYEPNQRKRICRWLDQHGIPHQENRLGDPVVLRSDVENPQGDKSKPNLDWLKTA